MQSFDLGAEGLRALNSSLHALKGQTNMTAWEITNPKGAHAIAAGVDAPVDITVRGSTGYYCAGMNKQATIRIKGSAGPGVAENMMSGTVIIDGNASQYAGATGSWRIAGDQGQCLVALRGVDEGDRHRRAWQHRPHVGLHGAVGQSWWCWAMPGMRWVTACMKRGCSCVAA
jgi:glutamate synthase domain-containing protein 3